MPSADEILAVALRCAFGPVLGHPVDPATVTLLRGNYEGEYSDSGLIVHWHAGRVEVRATAHRFNPGIDYGRRVQAVPEYRVLLRREFTWEQLAACVDGGPQLSLRLQRPPAATLG